MHTISRPRRPAAPSVLRCMNRYERQQALRAAQQAIALGTHVLEAARRFRSAVSRALVAG